MFASYELLQYLNKSTNSGEIIYTYDKMDVFSLGMTFLIMIINRKKEVDYNILTNLRKSSQTVFEFSKRIDKIMDELLPELSNWKEEFSRKLFEVIKSCLQIDIELRPNALQLFAIFQYFPYTTLPQLKDILSDINNSDTIKELVRNYVLYIKLNYQTNQPKEDQRNEDNLELCKEYEEQHRHIYGRNDYENTLEYLDLCIFYEEYSI